MVDKGVPIAEAKGKLGILLVGLGAVSTTFVAGVEAVRKGLGRPFGSLTQMGTIRLGKRTENRVPMIKNFVPLADLDDIEFLAWDPFEDSAYEAALKCGVLEESLVNQLRPELEALRPHKAVFNKRYVRKLDGHHIKQGANKYELAQQLIEDIRQFRESRQVDRLVMIWCASTEVFIQPSAVHETLESFEAGLRDNHDQIPSSMVYAYAALTLGIPFANGAPNLTIDIPALRELAQKNHVPVCGKDFKTGQTWMKTVIAPGLKARLLGLSGWFSTNILGNRDGEVLDDPDSFRTKEESKLSVLEYILQPTLYPELYEDFYHKVRINYYPPRKD
ncbi:MAG: inositol-3-phosphate synthase, partial [Acidobacteriota bacterium]